MTRMFLFLISAILFVSIDSIYLSFIKDYFNQQVKIIQGHHIRFNMTAAIITYIFLIYGLDYFIISKKKSVLNAFIFGLVMYGVYEFTNLTIFSDWHWKTAFIDTLWGGILFSTTTFATYQVEKLLH
jgi:uncharacterized membrane protein